MLGEQTRVYLTVDVECAEERVTGSRIRPPVGYDLRVWGRFANQRRELGIRLILDEMESHGLRGTFFVETLCQEYFGLAGLTEVVAEIRGRGHDVQLHIHPIFKHIRWASAGQPPPEDDFAAYPRERQIEFLQEGIEILTRCGIPRGEITGFRAGNYGANNETWAALQACGLKISSNHNLAFWGRSCQIQRPQPEIGLFRTESGVWELPITCFREPGGGYRHLQITSVSLPELIHSLRQARRLGVGEVCIVMHSFEFFHLDSVEKRQGRLNTVNYRRLRGLCQFLSRHADQFAVETVSQLAQRLPVSAQPRRAPSLQGVGWRRYTRLLEQAYKRAEQRFAWV